jgi:hypothetical protein
MHTGIGLKSSLDPDQLTEKLRVEPFPQVLEFHLTSTDTDALILGTIERLRVKHPELRFMLHTPLGPQWHGALAVDSTDIAALLRFARLCGAHPAIIGGVMHTETHGMPFLGMRVARNLAVLREKVPDLDTRWWFENLSGETGTAFGFRAYLARFGIRQVTVDVSHWLAYNDQASLEEFLAGRRDAGLPTYVHISDHVIGDRDTKPRSIGSGDADFGTLLPLIDFGVIETFSEPERLGREMKRDYVWVTERKAGVRRTRITFH